MRNVQFLEFNNLKCVGNTVSKGKKDVLPGLVGEGGVAFIYLEKETTDEFLSSLLRGDIVNYRSLFPTPVDFWFNPINYHFVFFISNRKYFKPAKDALLYRSQVEDPSIYLFLIIHDLPSPEGFPRLKNMLSEFDNRPKVFVLLIEPHILIHYFDKYPELLLRYLAEASLCAEKCDITILIVVPTNTSGMDIHEYFRELIKWGEENAEYIRNLTEQWLRKTVAQITNNSDYDA